MSDTSEAPCSNRTWYAGLAGILLAYLLIRIPLLSIPFVRDEGFYGVAAQALLRGAVMYRDVFDHKPPGIFYIYKLALSIFPATPTGLHLFLHIWNFVTLALVMSLAHALGGRLAAVWSGWIFTIYGAAAAIDGHIASTELFMLLPIAACLLLALVASKLSSSGGRAAPFVWAASGVFGAAACWIKQPVALQLLVIPLFLILNVGRLGILKAARMYACWLLGGIFLSALICFAFRDVFDEFFRWSFVQSSEYFMTLWDERWATFLLAQVGVWARDLAFPLAVCVIALGYGIYRKNRLAWVGAVLFIFSIVCAIQNGFSCGHYFALTMLPIALICGIALAAFLPTLKPQAATWPVYAGILSVVPLLWATPNYQFFPMWEAEFEAAKYLDDRSRPEDSILVLGQEPQILFLAQRKSANPYIDLIELQLNTRRHSEFQHHAWDCIEADKPLYMIFSYQSSHWTGGAGVDQFFRQRCTLLQHDYYRLESLLIFDNEQAKFRFVHSLDESPRNSTKLVRLLEFWRRADIPPEENPK